MDWETHFALSLILAPWVPVVAGVSVASVDVMVGVREGVSVAVLVGGNVAVGVRAQIWGTCARTVAATSVRSALRSGVGAGVEVAALHAARKTMPSKSRDLTTVLFIEGIQFFKVVCKRACLGLATFFFILHRLAKIVKLYAELGHGFHKVEG